MAELFTGDSCDKFTRIMGRIWCVHISSTHKLMFIAIKHRRLKGSASRFCAFNPKLK